MIAYGKGRKHLQLMKGFVIRIWQKGKPSAGKYALLAHPLSLGP